MSDNAQMRESAPKEQKPGKVIYGTLRMAKASQADMDTAYRLMRLLESIDRGYYPSNEEGAPTFFDSDDWEHLQFLHQQICEIADNSGGVSRVIGAASVLLNPGNNLIDPDDDCIELHPDLRNVNAAGEEAEKLRARVAELESELRDDHWPHGATVKLRWVGSGYCEKHGWAKRGAEGQLITVCSGVRLDESKWEVVQERKVQPARGKA